MRPLSIGDITVSKLVEAEGPFMEPTRVMPDATSDVFEAHRSWLAPHFHDYAQNLMIFSFHSYIVKTPHHTIVVDTCVGNHKDRHLPEWHQLNTPYLDDMRAQHVAPEDVDYVMCTHLHGDHVGSPFFDPASGAAVATPHVLTAEELRTVVTARDAWEPGESG